MGLYPVIRRMEVNTGRYIPADEVHRHEAWYEEYDDFSGLVRYRLIEATDAFTIRDNCYCCSCGVNPDPYCRNHGFAGMRPCVEHDQPGQAGDDGVMPASVQAIRLARAAQHEHA